MIPLLLAVAQAAATPAVDTTVDRGMLESRVDVYDPTSGAFVSRETTWFDSEGHRLRLEIVDATGAPRLLFYIRSDLRGREAEAVYFESGPDPVREAFTYSDDDRV